MQTFQDTQTGRLWAFDDGLNVAELPNVPATLSAVIVPQPDPFHDWAAGAWVLNQARKDAAESDAAKAALKAIDQASIRSIREYIAARADAPQILKDHEAAAIVARGKVRP